MDDGHAWTCMECGGDGDDICTCMECGGDGDDMVQYSTLE